MGVYAIALINIADRDGFAKYEKGFMEIFSRHHGKVLSVDEAPVVPRLAALVPRPRGNLVRHHGILAPNAKHRSAVVPNPWKRTRRRRTPGHARVPALGGDHQDDRAAPTVPMTADCIAISIPFAVRTDAIDLSIRPDCGGRLRVIADVTRPDVIQRI